MSVWFDHINSCLIFSCLQDVVISVVIEIIAIILYHCVCCCFYLLLVLMMMLRSQTTVHDSKSQIGKCDVKFSSDKLIEHSIPQYFLLWSIDGTWCNTRSLWVIFPVFLVTIIIDNIRGITFLVGWGDFVSSRQGQWMIIRVFLDQTKLLFSS